MRIAKSLVTLFVFAAFHAIGVGEEPPAPDPQPAHIAGTVTDMNGGVIPGAEVVALTPTQDPHSALADGSGFFQIDNLTPGTGYQVTVSAKGFTSWKSPEVLL